MSECTDWDEAQHHHNFTTVVQHQSMPQTGSLSIGGNEYHVGVVASQEDTADFSVVTTPVDASNTEVCLIYASDGAITPSFAEQTFSSLCKAITAFTEDPEATLFPDAGAASALLLSSATAAFAESSEQVVNADLVMAAGTSVEQTTMLGPVS
jgi:hypothetical protein